MSNHSQQIVQQTRTASAHADDSETDTLFRLEGNAHHGRVSGFGGAGENRWMFSSYHERRAAERCALHESSSRDFVRWLMGVHSITSGDN